MDEKVKRMIDGFDNGNPDWLASEEAMSFVKQFCEEIEKNKEEYMQRIEKMREENANAKQAKSTQSTQKGC